MEAYIGEIAALLAAFSFSITSVCFTLAGRKISSIASMAFSMPISWVIISVLHLVTLGEFFPMSAPVERWLLLGASGLCAFVISSYFILSAYQYIGPRLTMLVASLAPIFGAILAWIFVGQTLPANSSIGIVLVIIGILWVVSEKNPVKKQGEVNVDLRRGLLYAFIGAVTQGMAFVFSSQGVAGGFPPLSGNLMRTTVSIIAVWIVLVKQNNISPTIAILRANPKTLAQVAGAAIAGPVIAASMLLLAFQHIPVGVASTLSHTTAIMLIPIGYFVFRERISPRAISGTVIAIAGIAVLFMPA